MAAETRVCRRVKYSAPVGIRLVRTDSDRARIRILGTLLHVTLELICNSGNSGTRRGLNARRSKRANCSLRFTAGSLRADISRGPEGPVAAVRSVDLVHNECVHIALAAHANRVPVGRFPHRNVIARRSLWNFGTLGPPSSGSVHAMCIRCSRRASHVFNCAP